MVFIYLFLFLYLFTWNYNVIIFCPHRDLNLVFPYALPNPLTNELDFNGEKH